MRAKALVGGVLAGFLLAASGALAQERQGAEGPETDPFRTSVSLPFSVLAADRVEGMLDVARPDPFQDLPQSITLLLRRADLILSEHGKLVSDDLRRLARQEGRDVASAASADLSLIDEQAMIALVLPAYLEAEDRALTEWGGVIGLTELEATRFSVLTLSAGLRDLLAGDEIGAADLVTRSRDILDTAGGRDGILPMVGYQTQVLAGMGAMTSLGALDQAVTGLGGTLEIGAMTATEAASPSYPGS